MRTNVILSFISSFLLLVGIPPARAQSRSQIPVRAVPLTNGATLYSIRIKVGATDIEAGLDTGSTGLRVLPGTFADGDVTMGDAVDPGRFSSGVRYEGRSARGTLTIGNSSGTIDLEAVETVTYAANKPDCPAAHISPSDFGVRGNSLTGGRFRAIFGINTGGAIPQNPLLALGVKRWIVELARPGETGWLILNPTDDETKDFTPIPNIRALHDRGGLRDAVNGCLINAETKVKACWPMLLDSGAPNIRLLNMSTDAFTDGQSAAFIFYDADGARVIEDIVLGQTPLGTRMRADRNEGMKFGVIFAGTAPYQGIDVLYDPEHEEIGVKPRPTIATIPAAQIISKR